MVVVYLTMVDYSKIHHDLIKFGYYTGTFSDFYNHDTGFTEHDMRSAADLLLETEKNIEKVYVYRHNFIEQHTKNYLNNKNYTGPIPGPEEELQEVSYDNINKRKQFILDAQAGGADIRTTQQWYRLSIAAFDDIDPSISATYYKIDNVFANLFRTWAEKIYPEYHGQRDKIRCASQYSIYKQGDFSEIHFDGINPGRAFVIIMYFADPATYHKDSGGELRIVDSHVDIKVKPLYGNYAMLDFSKWNIGHSIELVKGDFVRFALQSFVGIF